MRFSAPLLQKNLPSSSLLCHLAISVSYLVTATRMADSVVAESRNLKNVDQRVRAPAVILVGTEIKRVVLVKWLYLALTIFG